MSRLSTGNWKVSSKAKTKTSKARARQVSTSQAEQGHNQQGENQPGENQPGHNEQGQNQPAENQPGQNQREASQGMPLVSAKKLIGTDVKTTDGNNAGQIKNLLIGANGQVRAAVVEWGGGIFGIGSNENVVPITQIRMANKDHAEVNLTKKQLTQLPTYNAAHLNQYGAVRPYK